MPEVWYDMELEDFMLMQKGFFERRKDDDLSFAKVAFYIAAIHQNISGKPIYSSRFMSDWFGEEKKKLTSSELKDRSKSIMDRVKLKNKILEEKEKTKPVGKKVAKRIKNSN